VRGRNRSLAFLALLSLPVLLLWPERAHAYVGPGADVTFIGYFMTLLVWALAAFSAVLLWPIYTLLGWIRGRNQKAMTTPTLETAPEEARATSHTDA
jgi:hypothetical protein